MERSLLILTATVAPNTIQKVALTNPDERLAQYVTNIRKTIKKTATLNLDILIAENSGNVGQIADKLGRDIVNTNKIKFVSCKMGKSFSKKGISSNEHEMLRKVSNEFDIENYSMIWKLTGRLSIDNISQIITQSTGDFRANSYFLDHHTFDARFFGLKRDLFLQFARCGPRYSQNLSICLDCNHPNSYPNIERFLADFAFRIEMQGYSYRSLPFVPIFRGQSGSRGKEYGTLSNVVITYLLNKVRSKIVRGLLGVSP